MPKLGELGFWGRTTPIRNRRLKPKFFSAWHTEFHFKSGVFECEAEAENLFSLAYRIPFQKRRFWTCCKRLAHVHEKSLIETCRYLILLSRALKIYTHTHTDQLLSLLPLIFMHESQGRFATFSLGTLSLVCGKNVRIPFKKCELFQSGKTIPFPIYAGSKFPNAPCGSKHDS